MSVEPIKINWRVDQTNGDTGETTTICGRTGMNVYHPRTLPEIREELMKTLINTVNNAEPGTSRALFVEIADGPAV